MAVITSTLRCDLQKPVQVQYLSGNLFSQDNAANRIAVEVYDGGEPATISGSVSANIIRADGGTVAATGGSISDNVASITLPSAAYLIPGVVSIVVKITVDSTVTTIAAIVANVYTSSTDTPIDPGTIIPSVQTLIAEIEAAVAKIPADYSALWTSLAPAFSTDTNYIGGQYVTYNGGVYKFRVTHSGAWDATHVLPVTVGGELEKKTIELKQVAETANQIVYYGSEATGTYRTITYDREGYDITIDGTSDATIKMKISGSIQSAISSSYPAGWSKSIPLVDGRKYRLSSAVISGTVSATVPSIYITDSNGTNVVNGMGCDNKSVTFTGNGNNALIYIYIASGRGGTALKLRITLVDITDEATQDAEIAALQDALINTKQVTKSLTTGGFYADSTITVGSTMPSTSSSSNGKYTATPVDISFAANSGILTMSLETVTSSSTVGYAVTDENNIVLYKGVTSDDFKLVDGVYTHSMQLPSGSAKYLYFSVYQGSATLTVDMTKADKANASHIRFVAPDGDDDNDGTDNTHAFATINAAIKSGGHTIMLADGIYKQNIDLSLAVDEVRIMTQSRYAKPVLYAPNCLITELETAVADTTKVYSCSCTKSFDDKNIWIFQDGVPDAATEITAADRHPLQRGRQYRCPDTKIVRCSASTTEAAIAEIEAASGYKWFIDTTEHVLYFSRPQTVSANAPICASFGSSLFSNYKRGLKVEMIGIGVKYQKINLTGFGSPILTDCFVGNVRSEAGIQYDGSAGAKLYRCEAFRVFFTANSGDGINAHSGTSGDAFAKQTGSFQIDCWSHDNCDDGYSDHERCETTIIGGLYENNGAGVTPAQGSHCTCYNTLSRYNGEADFFYTGNPSSAEGGVGGQIACYGCVSKGSGSGRGFRLNGSAVQGLFVNCVCINRATGFYGESGGGTQVGTLVNCTTINCATQKSDAFTAMNGTPVT